MTGIRGAVWVPLFDALSDPRVAAGLAAEAEEYGWDGFFTWDHLRWREPIQALADPWIVLAAAAAATSRIRLGPMVSVIARRRPAVLSRQTASLDLLSDGRLVLGVGIGGDRFGEEYSRFGDEVDDRIRAEMTDEALDILRGAWSGETVTHLGAHYTVDGVRFLPRPAQRPGIPVWVAGFPGRQRPRQRAARHDGFFPVNLEHPDQLAEAVEAVMGMRADPSAPYDVAVDLPPGTDTAPYAAAGATWWLTAIEPENLDVDTVRGIIRDGPR